MLSNNRSQLLAEDVRIFDDASAPGFFQAHKPGSPKTVALTAAQAFLAEGLRHPYSEVVLLAKCNARFSGKIAIDDLRNLIEVLDDAGLMVGGAAEANSSYPSGAPDNSSAAAPPVASEDDSLGDPPQVELEDDSGRATYRNHWSLCKPQPFLDRALTVLAFLRHLNILVPFVFILALVGFFNNLDLFFLDISGIKSRTSELGRLLFTMFTVGLITQLYRGLTARYFGFATPSFGLILVFGLLPRFNMRVTVPQGAERKARLWTLGAPIYVRFIVFPFGIILWLTTRDQGTSLPLIGAALAMVSMISLLFVANPLLGGAGYRFLSEYFATPNLRKKAFVRLRALFSRQPPVVMKYVDRSPAVLVYGVLSILFSLMIMGFMGFMAARWLELNYQGLGVAVFLFVIVYLFFRFGYQDLRNRQRRQRAKSVVASSSSPDQPVGLAARVRLYGRHLFFLALLGACFLPYQYECGGEAEIFPAASAKIYAEYPDLVGRVYFDGGEVLKQGTVVAEMVNERQQHDVEKTQEEIRKQQEELNILLTTPLPEQITLAQEELTKSEVLLRYSQQQLERMEGLYQDRAVALVEYQDALRQVELDQQLIKTARANLDYVKNQINKHKIESTRIDISILQDQLAYYQQVLDRTRLKMPIDGKIITMNLKKLQDSYLEAKTKFAEVEDASKVRVEIKIPEGDVEDVAPGDSVKIRLRAYPNRLFGCEVRNVYTMTMEDTLDRYLMSDCLIPNEKGELKSSMTGFAKIEGREMFVVSAFSRALVRFFRVEVWSWLP